MKSKNIKQVFFVAVTDDPNSLGEYFTDSNDIEKVKSVIAIQKKKR